MAQPILHKLSELQRAATRVIREYRDHDELTVVAMAEGKLVQMRNALALALDDLEKALDVATDTAEVLSSQTDGENADEPTAKDLLGQCWHHVYSIEQLAALLHNADQQTEEAYGAAHAIKHVAEAAYTLIDTAKERMGAEVTPAVIAISKRLRKHGCTLLADATNCDSFSVLKLTSPGPQFEVLMFLVSIESVEAWLVEQEGGGS